MLLPPYSLAKFKNERNLNDAQTLTNPFALILFAGTVYNLSYMHERFEPILLETLNMTDKQFGDLRAMLGVVMMLCYFPGGWRVILDPWGPWSSDRYIVRKKAAMRNILTEDSKASIFGNHINRS